ncbi:hypothetical protein C4552_00540 [Candidatus Parcubacteria bacterium]|nr:MAG: hypothetical protein C4552_00540 [Candidatus Parcubacteria bacterium]
MEERIYYRVEKGNIRFEFDRDEHVPSRRHPRTYRHYHVSGIVPSAVVRQGEPAVRRYAERFVQREIGRQKAADRRYDERLKTLDIPIVVMHGSVRLVGRVRWSETEDSFVLLLEKPVQREIVWSYGRGFGAAMAGKRVLERWNLTANARRAAEAELILAFEQQRPNSPHNLVERLNRNAAPEKEKQ